MWRTNKHTHTQIGGNPYEAAQIALDLNQIDMVESIINSRFVDKNHCAIAKRYHIACMQRKFYVSYGHLKKDEEFKAMDIVKDQVFLGSASMNAAWEGWLLSTDCVSLLRVYLCVTWINLW